LLAIEVYEQGRSTRAVTETVLGDMAEQIVDAERALESVKIDSEQPSWSGMPRWLRYTLVAAVLTCRGTLSGSK
jgi:hypothetical protein